MSAPVLALTGKTHPTVKNNEETLCMTNTYMKKNLNFPWLDSSWSLYQLIHTLALGVSPFPLGLFIVVETLMTYLTLRFEWIKLWLPFC